jgi:cell division septation protein DedD
VYAIEIGPLLTQAEADQVERRLNQAGLQAARFRQRTGASVYGVFIDNIPSRHDAEALAATLREQGFPGPAVVGSAEPFALRIGPPAALRIAVDLAERMQAKGHIVRVSAQAGEAVRLTVRHGTFNDREEAERRSRELAGQGVPNQVVQVK